MTKRHINVDDDLLEAARVALNATTVEETVELAVRAAAAAASRRRFVERMCADGLPDLRDVDVMKAAWR